MPSLCSMETQWTSLRAPKLPSSLTMNLGTTKGEISAVPHLLDGGGDELGQALAAVVGILGKPVPAVFGKAPVRVLESGRRLDASVRLPDRALAIADRVQRVKDFGGELRCFVK